MLPSCTRALSEKVATVGLKPPAPDAGAEELGVRLAREIAEPLVEHALEQALDQ